MSNNGFTIIDYDTILVNHPKHKLEIIDSNEIIFKNIVYKYDNNLNKYNIGGITGASIKYKDYLGKHIFNIERVST